MTRKRCEACNRLGLQESMRVVGAESTGDKNAQVCVDALACQRTIVAAKRRKRKRRG